MAVPTYVMAIVGTLGAFGLAKCIRTLRKRSKLKKRHANLKIECNELKSKLEEQEEKIKLKKEELIGTMESLRLKDYDLDRLLYIRINFDNLDPQPIKEGYSDDLCDELKKRYAEIDISGKKAENNKLSEEIHSLPEEDTESDWLDELFKFLNPVLPCEVTADETNPADKLDINIVLFNAVAVWLTAGGTAAVASAWAIPSITASTMFFAGGEYLNISLKDGLKVRQRKCDELAEKKEKAKDFLNKLEKRYDFYNDVNEFINALVVRFDIDKVANKIFANHSIKDYGMADFNILDKEEKAELYEPIQILALLKNLLLHMLSNKSEENTEDKTEDEIMKLYSILQDYWQGKWNIRQSEELPS